MLSVAMGLSMLPGVSLAAEGDTPDEVRPVISAGGVDNTYAVEEDTREVIGADTLARLRAGKLTKAEVDKLIEQGLTLEDLQDPYAIAPMGITTADERVNPAYFKFTVTNPDGTTTYNSYAELQARYEYLREKTWEGPYNKAQVDEKGNYYQDHNARNNYPTDRTFSGVVTEGAFYPHLTGAKEGVEYEVQRLSYHDTTVKRIGNIEITTADAGKLTYVYISSERTTGSTSHFIIPAEDDGSVSNANKITVEYAPLEYAVRYQVFVDGVSHATTDPTFGSHAIFGSTRSETTTMQNVVAEVTIPDGYYARVYIVEKSVAYPNGESHRDPDGNERAGHVLPYEYVYYADSIEGGSKYDPELGKGVTSPYEKFPIETDYGQFPLGMGPNFVSVGGTEVVLDTSRTKAPGYFALSATYRSNPEDATEDGKPLTLDGDVVVRAVLSKRTTFTVSNDLWGGTTTSGDITQREKIKGTLLGGERTIFIKKKADGSGYELNKEAYNDIKPSTGKPYVIPDDVEINDDGSYDFTWSFTTQAVNSGLYILNYELYTLSVNGENVEVPVLRRDPGLEHVGPDTAVQTDKQSITNAEVRVTVTAVDVGRDGDSRRTRYQRQYDVEFTNVTRNIVITTSALEVQSGSQFVVGELTGVDLQVWSQLDGTRKWNDMIQGETLNTSGNFVWGTYASEDHLGQLADSGAQIPESGKYNARFKLQNGYEWASGVNNGVTFTYRNGTGQDFTSADQTGVIVGPDQQGYYYVSLANNNNSSINRLSIKADLKRYRVKYMDGVTEGTAMQDGASGLPEKGKVDNMPDYHEWNKGQDPHVDNNAGRGYDMVFYDTIRTSPVVPTDTAERPAVFKLWVLTDKYGNPIDRDGRRIIGYKQDDGTIDTTKLRIVEGDTLRRLSDVASAAEAITVTTPGGAQERFYEFYLTAYWVSAAEAFTYYVTFNKTNERGGEINDVYHPGNHYPILNKTDGTPTNRYAAADRNAHVKVTSTTVAFDPDSSLVASYMATDPWYRLDERKSNDFVYKNVQNRDIIAVWFIYTLGGLTVRNTVDAGADTAPQFPYTVTFTLPADDVNTTGDETLFFDQGYLAYLKTIAGTDGTGFDADTAKGSASGVYSIGYKDDDGQTGKLTLKSEGGRTYTGAFSLGAGRSITFDDLPAGTTYSVTEGDVPGSGYGFRKVTKTSTVRAAGTANMSTGQTNAVVSGAIAALTDDVVVYENKLGIQLAKTQSVNGRAPSAGKVYVKPGDTITYYTTVKNASNAEMRNFTVTDKLDSHLTYVPDSADRGGTYTAADNTVKWSIAALAAGGEITLSFKATVTSDEPSWEITIQSYAEAKETVDAGAIVRYTGNTVVAEYVPVDFTVTNTVGGHGGETGRSFTFTVTLDDETIDGSYGGMTFKGGVATFLLKGGESATAKNLPSGAGYRVVEAEANQDGYTTTVTGNNAAGTLAKNGSDGMTVAFVNNRPTPATVNLTGTKTLNSNDEQVTLAANMFSFTIRPQIGQGQSGSGPVPASGTTVQNGAGDNVNLIKFLDNAQYVRAGTYVYSVYEEGTQLPHYQTDNATYTVRVVVSGPAELSEQDRAAGNYALGTSITITKVGGDGNSLVFVNSYNAKEIYATAEATKHYNGTLQENAFEIELTGRGGAPLPGNAKDRATVKNGVGGGFRFDNYAFTATGRYEYIMKEVKPDHANPDIDYDQTQYKAVVVVSDDDGDGELDTEVVYSKKTATDADYVEMPGATKADVIFTNIINSDLTVTQSTVGGRAEAARDFHFTLTLKDTTVNDIALKASDINGPYGTADGDGIIFKNGVAEFALKGGKSITIKRLPVGMEYEIVEAEANQDDYTTTVTGTDGPVATGTIGEDGTAVEFVNRKPGAATLTDDQKTTYFKGRKTSFSAALGGEIGVHGEEFTFSVTPGADNPAGDPIKAPGQRRVKNDNGGVIDLAGCFHSLDFTAAGVYTYTIAEDHGSAPGHVYDDSVYTVTVSVTDPGGESAFEVESIALTKDGQPADQITFANRYTPAAVTLDEADSSSVNGLVVKTVLTGAALNAGDFGFFVTPDADNPAADPLKGQSSYEDGRVRLTNDAYGNIRMPNGFTFTAVGLYTYTMQEISQGHAGYVYDTAAHTITFQVSDNHAEGKLEVAIFVDGNPDTHTLIFNNAYYAPTPAPEINDPATEEGLYVTKRLVGAELEAGQFQFTVRRGANNPAGGAIQGNGQNTVTNDADGKIKLFTTANGTALMWTQAGVYTYTVYEEDGNEAGYYYDPNEYTIIVTVTGTVVDGKGQLTAATQVKDKDGNDLGNLITFKNRYAPNSVTVDEDRIPDPNDPGDEIHAKLITTATLTGADLTAGQFSFAVTPKEDYHDSLINDNTVDAQGGWTVSNDASGRIYLFSDVYFVAAGEYTFTVSQVEGGAEGYTYDANQYTVTVKVEAVDGKLAAATSVTDAAGADLENRITFANSYSKPTVTVSIQKVWVDNNDPNRPGSVSVRLLRDGESYGELITLDASTQWKASVTVETGYTWTVEEQAVEGYTAAYANDGNAWTVTNTKNSGSGGGGTEEPDPPDTVTLTIQKVWVDNNDPRRPGSVSVRLLRDGKSYGELITLSASKDWKASVTVEAGHTWAVQEQAVEGYTATYAGSGNAWTVTNTKNSTGNGGGGTGGGGGGSAGSGQKPSSKPNEEPTTTPEPTDHTTHQPSVTESKHGRTTITPANPEPDDQVIVRPEPDLGYKAGKVVVTDANGKVVEVLDNGDGSYTFTQPADSVTIDVSFVCTQLDYCPIGTFDDSEPQAWYHEGIHFCLEEGLMVGYDDNTFRPDDPTNRAMIATILWRLEGESQAQIKISDFADLKADAWYTEAIRWAAERGIVNGYGDGVLGPEDVITREQLIAMLFRYAKAEAGEGDLSAFADADSVANWARGAMSWAVSQGIITGREHALLAPQDRASRAEAATMLMRFLERGA